MKQASKLTAFMKELGINHKDRSLWHVEPRKGKEEEAIAYCQKADTRAPGESCVQMFDVDFDADMAWNDYMALDYADLGIHPNEYTEMWSDAERTPYESDDEPIYDYDY